MKVVPMVVSPAVTLPTSNFRGAEDHHAVYDRVFGNWNGPEIRQYPKS